MGVNGIGVGYTVMSLGRGCGTRMLVWSVLGKQMKLLVMLIQPVRKLKSLFLQKGVEVKI